jgi:hypothetical protein
MLSTAPTGCVTGRSTGARRGERRIVNSPKLQSYPAIVVKARACNAQLRIRRCTKHIRRRTHPSIPVVRKVRMRKTNDQVPVREGRAELGVLLLERGLAPDYS